MIDDFRTNLEPVNALAEVSPGFVWRLQDDSGNATSIKPFDEVVLAGVIVHASLSE